jgi:putative membrane protein
MTGSPFSAIASLPLAGFSHDSGPWDSEWWWVGRIAMFLVFIALVVLAVWWARRYPLRHEVSGLERARGILAERYARGEIDAEEYRERLTQLD